MLAGNHEYWHHRHQHEEVNEQILKNCGKLHNIEYLNDSETKLDNFVVLGATLWSPFSCSFLHQRTVKWLDNSINENTATKIVLTHYMPSFKLIVPKYQTPEYDKIRNRYASDLNYLIKPPVRVWLCGHSHCTYETHINGVLCGINALGYENKQKGTCSAWTPHMLPLGI